MSAKFASEIAPSLTAIKLKTGREIALEPGSVLALVGANNSGKSHFLRQLQSILYDGTVGYVDRSAGLIKGVDIFWPEGDTASYLRQVAKLNFKESNSIYMPNLPEDFHGQGMISPSYISSMGVKPSKFGLFVEAFVRYDDPVSRISEANKLSASMGESMLTKLQRQNEVFEQARQYFKSVFDEEFHIARPDDRSLWYYVGEKGPTDTSLSDPYSEDLRNFYATAPRLDLQGYGMRSVFGLLARLLTDSRPIALIDEPDAFLHPPQAARLGEIIAEICKTQGRQVVCATHNRSFLGGLCRGRESSVRIERLQREQRLGRSGVFSSDAVDPRFWEEARNESRIRFTTVLDSLFYGVAVLVENEKDALFYEAAIQKYVETAGSSGHQMADQILFVPVSGKNNFASTAKLLRKLKTPTVVLGDLDVLDAPEYVEQLLEGLLGDEWMEERPRIGQLGARFACAFGLGEKFFDLNKKEKSLYRTKSEILFKNGPELTDVDSSLGALLSELARFGLLLVPVGEMEDLFPQISKGGAGKAEWPRKAIDAGALEVENIKDFAKDILETCQNALSQKTEKS